MKSHSRKVLAGVAAATVLVGCGSSRGGDKSHEATASFTAAVEGSDAFIGVVVESDGRVMAYVCDDKSVASWLIGKSADDGTISLTSAEGVRLSGRVAGDHLSGSVTLPGGGAVHAFIASEVDSPAGLYRSKSQLRGEPAVGGWVVLEDGRQRGAVKTSSGFVSWEPDLARPNKPVTSFTSTETDI